MHMVFMSLIGHFLIIKSSFYKKILIGQKYEKYLGHNLHAFVNSQIIQVEPKLKNVILGHSCALFFKA